MGGHYLRKEARSAGWAWRLAAFAAVLLPVTILFFRLGALDQQGLSWSLALVAILAALALLLSFFAISRAWGRGDRGGGRAVAALALGLVVAVPFALGAGLATEYPAGNVAETSGIAAGGGPVPGEPGEEAPADTLIGRDFRATAVQVYGAAQTAIENGGWEIVDVATSAQPEPADGNLGTSGTVEAPIPTLRGSIDPTAAETDRFAALDADDYTIEAVAYAPVFAFPSDVTIRIVEADGESFVDVRSVSRTLDHDLGQNRRFIEGFFARLESAMTVLEAGAAEE